MIKKKERLSNLELLRIVAMMLIVYGHTFWRTTSFPKADDVVTHPLPSFLTLLAGCITTTGVGIFIAISGWFGIRLSKRGLANYLFQVLFILWAIYGIAIATGQAELNITGIKYSLGLYDGYWFIMAYLELYIASPVLNAFIEHSKKRDYQIVLILYFLFQACFSWLSAWYDYYNGYSIVMFCGIYLTAAYFRKYPVAKINDNSWKLLIATICIMAVIAFISTWLLGHAGRQIRDDNPLVIFACILLVIGFSRIKMKSRIINWLAASCFAVYLIHYSPFVYPHIMKCVKYINTEYSGLLMIPAAIITIALIYLVCTLFDQVRKGIWWGLRIQR